MKIPFDIKFRPQIQSGEYKVVTRNGSNAEFVGFRGDDMICWVNGAYRGYNRDGTIVDRDYPHYDLFIITPEPELTSWQAFISGCLQKYGLVDCGAADRIAKECSAELLELAKDELTKQGNLILPIEAFEKRYVEAQEKGRKEALKDLPRWKKADRDIISNTIEFAVPYTNDGGDHDDWEEAIVTNIVHKGESYLEISDLEKLPGFNE